VNIKNVLKGGKAEGSCGDTRNTKNCHQSEFSQFNIKNIKSFKRRLSAWSLIYVSFRSRGPEKSTVLDVLKGLQKNNIDFNKLLEWPADQCQ